MNSDDGRGSLGGRGGGAFEDFFFRSFLPFLWESLGGGEGGTLLLKGMNSGEGIGGTSGIALESICIPARSALLDLFLIRLPNRISGDELDFLVAGMSVGRRVSV